MDRAKNLPKVGDAERESIYGYVYAVSGPGEQFCAHSITEARLIVFWVLCIFIKQPPILYGF